MANPTSRTRNPDATLKANQAWLLTAPLVLVLITFFALPVANFLQLSFRPSSPSAFAGPGFSLESFTRLLTDPYYGETLGQTLWIAVVATFVAFVLALPVAYMITKSSPKVKSVLIIVTVFPLLVGNVVRAIGWVGILGYNGVVNSALTGLGLVSQPLNLLQTPLTVAFAIASVVLPMMVLTLQASMETVDPATERAAISLGARPFTVFRQVTIPQIVPGIIAATSLVFVLCLNAYAIPQLIGGGSVPMLAPVIYRELSVSNNWPLGGALAIVLLVLSMVVVAGYGYVMRRMFEGWRREAR